MDKIQLPSYPQDIPDYIEIRDLTDGSDYYRVKMVMAPSAVAGHFEMRAQCFEMNSDGSFKQEPNGAPSRCSETSHTVSMDAIGDTMELDDAWTRYVGEVTPDMISAMSTSDGKPSEPGVSYGDKVWDPTADAGNGKCWIWTEGFADVVARTKVEDMRRVLRTSNIHSGFPFRRT